MRRSVRKIRKLRVTESDNLVFLLFSFLPVDIFSFSCKRSSNVMINEQVIQWPLAGSLLMASTADI